MAPGCALHNAFTPVITHPTQEGQRLIINSERLLILPLAGVHTANVVKGDGVVDPRLRIPYGHAEIRSPRKRKSTRICHEMTLLQAALGFFVRRVHSDHRAKRHFRCLDIRRSHW